MSQILHISEFLHYTRHWAYTYTFNRFFEVLGLIPSGYLSSGETLIEFDRFHTFRQNTPPPLELLGVYGSNQKENLLTHTHIFWGRYLCALYSGTLTYFHNPYDDPLSFFYNYETAMDTTINMYLPPELHAFYVGSITGIHLYPYITI